jgi:histidyl-tRNA synthetase
LALVVLKHHMGGETKRLRAVKGMVDIMPPATGAWQEVEEAARRVFSTYGYHEIRTPIVESAQLFRRGVGETTVIVEKEMYSFVDRGGDALALRPEGTASVVRAYIETGAHVNEPVARYYYMGPMFRRERPQRGRQRQFYQIGCELMGVDSPLADAEVIAMASHLLDEVGASGLALEINSIGCPKCRPSFNAALVKYLKGCRAKLCDDCIKRIERNPLRILDCKQEECNQAVARAPRISGHWCAACREHFDLVCNTLDLLGVSYQLNERIVRGLDYYMRTAFEIVSGKLGAQNAVIAGGRFDGLVKALGGPDIAGVGFALGMERLLMLLEERRTRVPVEDLIFFAVIGEKAQKAVLPIIQTLRRDGVRVEWDYAARSLKAQMRRAGRLGAKTAVIAGDDEIAKGQALVRDMRSGTQHAVRISDLPMHFVQIDV